MNQVPEMISTKDLSYLADIFEWNFTACKKCYNFAGYIQETEIKELIGKVGNMHEIHCQKIINILGGNHEQ